MYSDELCKKRCDDSDDTGILIYPPSIKIASEYRDNIYKKCSDNYEEYHDHDELCKKNADDAEIGILADYQSITVAIKSKDISEDSIDRFNSVFKDTDIAKKRGDYRNFVKVQLKKYYRNRHIKKSKMIYENYSRTDLYYLNYLSWYIYISREELINDPISKYMSNIYRIYSYYIILSGIMKCKRSILDMQIVLYRYIAINFANVFEYLRYNDEIADIFARIINNWYQIIAHIYNIGILNGYMRYIRYVYLMVYRTYYIYKYKLYKKQISRLIYDIEYMIWKIYARNTGIIRYDRIICCRE